MEKYASMQDDRGAQTASEAPHVGRTEAIGQSEIFLEFQERLSRIARVNRPALLIGERGSGKELAVSRLHYLSPRWQAPLLALNCAALSPSLIESELFGHEPGAFTGAVGRRAGRFEAADGGTLFLDEIGQLPLEVQEKLLRVVEYGSFERVGGSQPIQADVRIIGATNADLAELARQGRFKTDLLDRLSFEVVFVPPLRERRSDIVLLARHFAGRMAVELGRHDIPQFSPGALAALEAYPWPGNIRELKNVVERAVSRSDDSQVTQVTEAVILFDPFRSPFEAGPQADDKPAEPEVQQPPQAAETKPFTQAVQELEIALLRKALSRAKYNQRRAAESLGLTYHQFRGLCRKYGPAVRDEG